MTCISFPNLASLSHAIFFLDEKVTGQYCVHDVFGSINPITLKQAATSSEQKYPSFLDNTLAAGCFNTTDSLLNNFPIPKL